MFTAVINAKTPSKTTRHAHLGPGQLAPHPRLREIVTKHLNSRWQKPVSGIARATFEALERHIAGHSGEIVLDSGCGTGASTLALAQRHPDCLVIGIDQSLKRLSQQGIGLAQSLVEANGVLFVRSDCADLWRLINRAQWPVRRHYLLYPNPWPKAAQVMRRWHAHPVFPSLLGIGGRIELRSNRQFYVEEFRIALETAGWQADQSCYRTQAGDTPFESKYLARGEPLWRVIAQS